MRILLLALFSSYKSTRYVLPFFLSCEAVASVAVAFSLFVLLVLLFVFCCPVLVCGLSCRLAVRAARVVVVVCSVVVVCW